MLWYLVRNMYSTRLTFYWHTEPNGVPNYETQSFYHLYCKCYFSLERGSCSSILWYFLPKRVLYSIYTEMKANILCDSQLGRITSRGHNQGPGSAAALISRSHQLIKELHSHTFSFPFPLQLDIGHTYSLYPLTSYCVVALTSTMVL